MEKGVNTTLNILQLTKISCFTVILKKPKTTIIYNWHTQRTFSPPKNSNIRFTVLFFQIFILVLFFDFVCLYPAAAASYQG